VQAITDPKEIELNVNDEDRIVTIHPADTLLYTLREGLGLTGAKPGCENGDCGACTVLVDGGPIKSCMMLTAEAIGHDIQTVEGLRGAPIQRAFIDAWAFQCGYCTSGFIMVAQGLLRAHPHADEKTMTEWLRSNICRCTSYEEIGKAVRSAIERGDEAARRMSEAARAASRRS